MKQNRGIFLLVKMLHLKCILKRNQEIKHLKNDYFFNRNKKLYLKTTEANRLFSLFYIRT